jgi:hypothetical protein
MVHSTITRGKSRMATYQITLESTADWTTYDINDNGRWVKTKDETITMTVEGAVNASHFEIGPTRAGLFKQQYSNNKIVAVVFVDTTATALEVSIGHGDCGTARISSAVDTQINDRILGDGQNRLPFTLHLTAAGAAEAAAARQAALNSQ